MVEKIFENIYRIPVPLPNNPLKELNSYYLRGEDRDILIDTGFRCDACREALERHHAARLEEVLRILREQPELTAYEIAGGMTWQIRARSWAEFPPVQKWFAVGECLAHLDYLRKRGAIARRKTDGIWRYFPV